MSETVCFTLIRTIKHQVDLGMSGSDHTFPEGEKENPRQTPAIIPAILGSRRASLANGTSVMMVNRRPSFAHQPPLVLKELNLPFENGNAAKPSSSVLEENQISNNGSLQTELAQNEQTGEREEIGYEPQEDPLDFKRANSSTEFPRVPLKDESDGSKPLSSLSQAGKNSHHSLGSSLGSDGRGREMVEGRIQKLLEVKGLVVSTVANILLAILFTRLYSEEGLETFSLLRSSGGVLIQISVNICHLLTGAGIGEASSLVFGTLMSQSEGFSLTICGYSHASILRKLRFTSFLSYRSKAKPILNIITRIWIFHYLLLIMTVFSSTNVTYKNKRIDNGELSCVIYQETGYAKDRGHPNLFVTMGNGEYVFGTSLGHMRSQEPVEVTTHVMPPQLIDMFVDGTTIVGPGYLTDIYTECSCALSLDAEELLLQGAAVGTIGELKSQFLTLGDTFGMANVINYGDGNDFITIDTLINHRNMCGGTDAVAPGKMAWLENELTLKDIKRNHYHNLV